MGDYVIGQVAAVLSKPEAGKTVKKKSKLAALFTVKEKPKQIKPAETEIKDEERTPKVKKRHQKPDDTNITVDRDRQTTQDELKSQTDENVTPVVHWSKLSGAARRLASKDSRKHNDVKDHRTIFVGNLPIALADKMKLKKLFGKYGAIENLRFRCPPTKDLTTSKRLAVIKKEFHPERSNIIAYVCYKEEFSAEKALQMNGKQVDGHHLRVDISTTNAKGNHLKSIFIGNLPFDIKEDDVRKMFDVCGDIDNIRIVRDNKSGFGKGFCYVVFKKKDCVELALKLDGSVINKREIRVKRCEREKTQKVNSDKNIGTNVSVKPWQQRSNRQPTNSFKHSFQGMKAKKGFKDKSKKRKIPRNSVSLNKSFQRNTTDSKTSSRKHFSDNKTAVSKTTSHTHFRDNKKTFKNRGDFKRNSQEQGNKKSGFKKNTDFKRNSQEQGNKKSGFKKNTDFKRNSHQQISDKKSGFKSTYHKKRS